jgi:hypothetical protein
VYGRSPGSIGVAGCQDQANASLHDVPAPTPGDGNAACHTRRVRDLSSARGDEGSPPILFTLYRASDGARGPECTARALPITAPTCRVPLSPETRVRDFCH